MLDNSDFSNTDIPFEVPVPEQQFLSVRDLKPRQSCSGVAGGGGGGGFGGGVVVEVVVVIIIIMVVVVVVVEVALLLLMVVVMLLLVGSDDGGCGGGSGSGCGCCDGVVIVAAAGVRGRRDSSDVFYRCRRTSARKSRNGCWRCLWTRRYNIRRRITSNGSLIPFHTLC